MKTWLKALRVPFLTASVLPVLTGLALVYRNGASFSRSTACLCLPAMALLHLGANLLNDYCDYLTGCDISNTHANPFSGGSRVIQQGLIPAKKMLAASIVLLAAGSLLGVLLAVRASSLCLWAIGLAGLCGGVIYSLPVFQNFGRGSGELLIGLLFGPLPVAGTVAALTGCASFRDLCAGIPTGLLILSVILVNEFPDMDADGRAGKKTLVVCLGTAGARWIVAAIFLLFYTSVVILVFNKIFPSLSLMVFLLLPVPVWVAFRVFSFHDKPVKLVPAMGVNIAFHSAAGLAVALPMFLGY